MDVFADLHVHTKNSDGTLTLEDLPEAARQAGVGAVAVTDHDRLHPDLPAPVVILKDVTVVHGIELRVEANDQQVDLLGYAAAPTPDLQAELDRLQANRIERGRAIIELVEDELGVGLDLDAREGIGRPHIARAIAAHPDVDYDARGAFKEFIGRDGPCYVAREIPDFETGVALLNDACGLISLAHPYRYDDVESALALTAELDAVEGFYPYAREVDPRPVERAIAEHDLLVTGGSDAHDDRLGEAGLSKDDYLRFRTACQPRPFR